MPRTTKNLEVPAEFVEAVDRIAERYGSKWLLYSAGMLLFLEASEAVQRDAVRRVQDTEWDGGDYGPLTAAAMARSRGEKPKVDVERSVLNVPNAANGSETNPPPPGRARGGKPPRSKGPDAK